jgi:pimeloyl-ACP methyl ester carboxylesterase
MASTGRYMMLRDGRSLGYWVEGAEDGRAVLYFPGFPGSRFESIAESAVYRRFGLKMIAVERPGYGLSSPSPSRRFADFARDAGQLVKHLGLREVDIVGWSTGGVYALACGASGSLPVRRISIVGAPAPVHGKACSELTPSWGRRIGWGLRQLPMVTGVALAFLNAVRRRDPERFERIMHHRMPRRDRDIVFKPEVLAMLQRSHAETFRQGAGHLARDLQLLNGEWDFNLPDVKAPVRVWCGDLDGTCPPACSEFLVLKLPNAELRIVAGEGHLLAVPQAEAILAWHSE